MENIPPYENIEKTEEEARAKTAEKVVSFLEKTQAYEKIEDLLDGQKDNANGGMYKIS